LIGVKKPADAGLVVFVYMPYLIFKCSLMLVGRSQRFAYWLAVTLSLPLYVYLSERLAVVLLVSFIFIPYAEMQ